MCFSATASFISALVLLIIGIFTIKLNKHPKYELFSYMPIIFSIQQFCEGILWLALTNNTDPLIQTIMTYIFVIVALMFWPMFIPLSMLLIEKNQTRRKILKYFLGLGISGSLYFLYVLLTNSISASMLDNHILYSIPMFLDNWILRTLYFLVIAGSFFVTSVPALWLFGTLVLATGIMTYLVWTAFLISVWCFFGAVVSIFILYLLTRKKIY